jgi:hypothetical protein
VRRSKEIIVLLTLLLGAVVFVLWYVADRRAKMRAAPAAPATTKLPDPSAEPQPFVQLGGPNEGKTIDFSSGKPVISDSPEDRAAIEKALREIADATRDVTFTADPKTATPDPKEPKKP